MPDALQPSASCDANANAEANANPNANANANANANTNDNATATTSATSAAGSAVASERQAVWRYLRALGASVDEADDLAQDTLAVGLATPPLEEPARQRAFLRGIARNLWLRTRRFWRRRREREVALAVEQLWIATADGDDGRALLANLRDCLSALQPRARQALELHYRDGLGWRDVATRIGLAPNGTKTLAQRARAALRQCLERSEPSERTERSERNERDERSER